MNKTTTVSAVYRQYAAAMARRRPESVLEYGRFRSYILRSDVSIVGSKGSYLVGKIDHTIFHPTHFAPLGPKSSVDLLKKLRSHYRVLWAVTPDLVTMLTRLGYIPFGVMLYNFRGRRTLKVLLADRISTPIVLIYYKALSNLSKAINHIISLISRLKLMKHAELPIDLDSFYKE